MGARRAAAWALAVALLAAPGHAQFVEPEGRAFRNAVALPLRDDVLAPPLLARLSAALDRGDADEAATVLRALRAEARPLLVPWGPRLLLPALERATQMVMEPGREATAALLLAGERRELAEARRTRDLELLRARATRGTVLPTAREAALPAARLLFEEGRFAEAQALAARAGADGAALAQAAARRLPPPPAAPPADLGARGWVARDAAALPAGEHGLAVLPWAARGPDGSLLWVDGQRVLTLQPGTRKLAGPPLLPLEPLQARHDDWLTEPAPRRHEALRAGELWLLPFAPLLSPFHGEAIPRLGALLAFDPRPPARVAWTALAEAGEAGSCDLSPPAAWAGRAYVQLFRTALETQVSLACLDLADGRLLWETPLATGQPVARYAARFAQSSAYQTDKRATGPAPALRDGVAWCCTGVGLVAAVDALDGRPLLAFRYDRLFPQDTSTWEPAWLYETGGWEEEPVRFTAGRVIVAPTDSRFLYRLAPEPGPGGQLILEDPVERLDRQHVVGLRPDPLGRDAPAVLCTRRSGGRSGLVLLGADGHVLSASPLLPPGRELLGRPLALGERVLLPTAAGLLEARADDLAAPPVPLPRLPGMPAPVVAVFALDDGLAALSPLPDPRDEDGDRWLLQWWDPAP